MLDGQLVEKVITLELIMEEEFLHTTIMEVETLELKLETEFNKGNIL